MQLNEIFEKKIKTLLKSYELEKWEESFKEDVFVKYIQQYTDKNGNNIYHLLFKNTLSSDDLYSVQQILHLLAKHKVPAMGLNDKNQLPYDLSEGQSITATNFIKELIKQEYNQNIQSEFD